MLLGYIFIQTPSLLIYVMILFILFTIINLQVKKLFLVFWERVVVYVWHVFNIKSVVNDESFDFTT